VLRRALQNVSFDFSLGRSQDNLSALL